MTPLPTTPPFLTFYTPTYMRPQALAQCLESVAKQTAREHIEQIVIPDHVGYGLVGGLFGRIPWYAEACRGQYVHILCDDDTLADPRAVERLIALAEAEQYPEVLVVRVQKGWQTLPSHPPGLPPEQGHVDLASYVLRRDVWLRHAGDYGQRYEGDYDHARVLFEAGYAHAYSPDLFLIGGQSHGRTEVAWA